MPLSYAKIVSTLIVTDYLYYSSYLELVLVTKKKNTIALQSIYLTIRPVARKGYGSIAHEAKLNGLLTRGP